MTLTEFINANKQELNEAISRAIGYVPKTASCYCPKSGTDHYHESARLTNADIRQWILNDEDLYRWARSEGVRI